MRIIALCVVIVTGGAMMIVDGIVEFRTTLDDLGTGILIAGLIAVGVELYVVPAVRALRERKRTDS